MKKWLNSNYSAINHHGGCQVKGGLGQGDLIWTRLLIQNCIHSGPSGLSHYHYVPLSRKRRQLFFFSFHKATVFPIACRVLVDICTKFHKCTIMHLSAKNWHIQPISIYVFICHPTMFPLVTDYSVQWKLIQLQCIDFVSLSSSWHKTFLPFLGSISKITIVENGVEMEIND